MKRNKELRKGDKIWFYSHHISEHSFYPVESVKKKGTLVEVVVTAEYMSKPYKIVMYGHASSSILSGFDRKWGNEDWNYTCDYALIERSTKEWDYKDKYVKVGKALFKIADILINETE
jgi:hypothetical protein